MMRIESHDLHGRGPRDHEVYFLPVGVRGWDALQDLPCPVSGCDQTVIWYEAGYVPGYRVCVKRGAPYRRTGALRFGIDTIRHRFMTTRTLDGLIRDDCCETSS